MSSLEPLCNFRRNPCSLEHIASVVSAAMLCRQAVIIDPICPPERVHEIIALPPVIDEEIDRFMWPVEEQIASWSSFYDREIFLDEQCNRAVEYFHVLVWSADGSINEEETAREMLKQDSINAAEKYRIACNHCLKNEIRTLWSNLNTKMSLRKAERCYPLVYYWECVCRKGKTTGLTKYIRERVFNGENVYPVCAADYFLNRLNLEKRISFLHHQYRYLENASFRSWQNFLMKLTYEETLNVLRHVDVLYYLMKFWMHADFVVQFWLRVRDWYSESAFVDLIGKYFSCEDFGIHSPDHISLAVEIFNLTPRRLQVAIFQEYIANGWWYRNSLPYDIGLDIAILSVASPDYRRYNFWAAQWMQVFRKYPVSSFLQFMDVCCEKEGTEEFEMKVMEMRDYRALDHSCMLLRGMFFSEIDDFLSLFSSDTSQIMKTKQIILRKNFFGGTGWFNIEGLKFPPPIELVDFIEESFENIRLANEFKIEILSSVACLNEYYKVAGSDMFNWLKEAVWMCSCSDNDFKLYTRKFVGLGAGIELVKSMECFIPDVFLDSGWMSFLEWCSN